MKKLLFFALLFIFNEASLAQSVTIDPRNTATNIIDAKSTNQGITVPKMTNAQKIVIANKVEGMMVYDTDAKQFSYWTGTTWVNFGNSVSAGAGWSQTGDDIINSNTGNVGIGSGTVSPIPQTKLSVLTFPNNYGIEHTDGNVSLKTRITASNIAAPAAASFGTTTNHDLIIHSNGGVSGAGLTLSTNGNIGMKNPSPTNKLHIGPATSPAFSGNDIAIGNASGGGMSFYQSGAANTGNSIWYSNANFALMPYNSTGKVGIGTLTPNATLQVNGGLSMPIKKVTSSYVVQDNDYTIVVEPSNDYTVIYLPSYLFNIGRIINITVPSFNENTGNNNNKRVEIRDITGAILYGSLNHFKVHEPGETNYVNASKTRVTFQCGGPNITDYHYDWFSNGLTYGWIVISDNYRDED